MLEKSPVAFERAEVKDTIAQQKESMFNSLQWGYTLSPSPTTSTALYPVSAKRSELKGFSDPLGQLGFVSFL